MIFPSPSCCPSGPKGLQLRAIALPPPHIHPWPLTHSLAGSNPTYVVLLCFVLCNARLRIDERPCTHTLHALVSPINTSRHFIFIIIPRWPLGPSGRFARLYADICYSLCMSVAAGSMKSWQSSRILWGFNHDDNAAWQWRVFPGISLEVSLEKIQSAAVSQRKMKEYQSTYTIHQRC